MRELSAPWRPASPPPLERFRAQPLRLYRTEGHPVGVQRGRPRRDGSGELAGFSPYRVGDDPRRLHWPSYLQRRALLTRLNDPPARGTLSLFLDRSATMRCGAPPRVHCADQLTLALAAAALGGGQRFQPYLLEEGRWRRLPPVDSVPRWAALAAALEAPPRGSPGLAGLGALLHSGGNARGEVLVISDGLWPQGLTQLLERLGLHWRPTLCLLEDPSDERPPAGGLIQPGLDHALPRALPSTRGALQHYQRRLEAHREAPLSWLKLRGGVGLRASTALPLTVLFQRCQRLLSGRRRERG